MQLLKCLLVGETLLQMDISKGHNATIGMSRGTNLRGSQYSIGQAASPVSILRAGVEALQGHIVVMLVADGQGGPLVRHIGRQMSGAMGNCIA